jgi:hypothetical protein
MDLMLFSLAVAASALAAGVMGYVIQRGGTCLVAAVEELLSQRRARRLWAMGEASLWVAGTLALAGVLGSAVPMPASYALTGWTLAGGALLGLGAWVNGACVFGAIARFGSGEWAYAATPLGFYVGCASVGRVFAPTPPLPQDTVSPVLEAGGPAALAFLAFAARRVVPPLCSAWREAHGLSALARTVASRVWAPHAATSVIGVTFVVILLLVGVWAYTDVLAQLALGMKGRLAAGTALLIALYLGAVLGGWTAGRLRHGRTSAGGIARCVAGGVLMAWGSLLIPGSNDGLILVGMPLVRPYAWIGFAAMAFSIAAAMLLHRRLVIL